MSDPQGKNAEGCIVATTAYFFDEDMARIDAALLKTSDSLAVEIVELVVDERVDIYDYD